ncbi:transcription factor HHO2 [Rhodamnia argentea]|uniref:Transcription factor HHO2 n=1 Tax=Rhodamnia argentea TaxID=178133 RepID=A0A8B8NLJ1_9MYRT|nr:transcription factor HHO2 [Rhodamnia argentea]
MCSASDSSPRFVPGTIRHFLTEIAHVADRSSKLDDFVERLQDELGKIDAFKRELPLCMLLLSEAIEALKKGSMRSSARPVLEQFVPLKKDSGGSEGVGAKPNDEKKWTTSSLMLLDTEKNFSSSFDLNENPEAELHTKIIEEPKPAACIDQSQFQTSKSRNVDTRESRSLFPSAMASSELAEIPLHGFLTLGAGMKNPSQESSSSTGTVTGRSRTISSADCNAQSSSRCGNQQTAKKRRRSWSPELHRRFVNALQQLGGAQVATPKQIRELMQVNGLTNDEVKSHLQKYRLHNQRLHSKASTAQKSGVLQDLQLARDISGDSLKMSGPQSPSPQSPLQIVGNPG